MIGHGVDMYDLQSLSIEDPNLFSTGQKFWVGVIEGMRPSPPVPRRRTKCYMPTPIYLYFDQMLFGMDQKDVDGNLERVFYEIPNTELIFIQ